MSEIPAKETNEKRVAVCYLPTGEKLRFVFDSHKNSEMTVLFYLEGKQISLMPIGVPMMFEDYKEQESIQEKLEKCFQPSGTGMINLSPLRTTAQLTNALLQKVSGVEVYYRNHLGYHSTEKLIYPNDIDETFNSTTEYIKERLIAKLSKNGLMQPRHISGTEVVSWKFI